MPLRQSNTKIDVFDGGFGVSDRIETSNITKCLPPYCSTACPECGGLGTRRLMHGVMHEVLERGPKIKTGWRVIIGTEQGRELGIPLKLLANGPKRIGQHQYVRVYEDDNFSARVAHSQIACGGRTTPLRQTKIPSAMLLGDTTNIF